MSGMFQPLSGWPRRPGLDINTVQRTKIPRRPLKWSFASFTLNSLATRVCAPIMRRNDNVATRVSCYDRSTLIGCQRELAFYNSQFRETSWNCAVCQPAFVICDLIKYWPSIWRKENNKTGQWTKSYMFNHIVEIFLGMERLIIST